MLRYKTFAAAFAYPDDDFFARFPDCAGDKDGIRGEYDRVFRAGKVWLYGAEYLIKNEFQRANMLSDLMGFYGAFGCEPDLERPDAITCEMEFMHFLIFKRNRLGTEGAADIKQKAEVCAKAERKFFAEHVAPGARAIAGAIKSNTKYAFYVLAADELVAFLEAEIEYFGLTEEELVSFVGCEKVNIDGDEQGNSYDCGYDCGKECGSSGKTENEEFADEQ